MQARQTYKKTGMAAAVALFLTLATPGALAFDLVQVGQNSSQQSASSIRCVSHTVNGNTVLVQVTNDGKAPETAYVKVVAEVNGNQVTGMTAVSLFPGGNSTVPVGFLRQVGSVIQVGTIVDGQDPF